MTVLLNPGSAAQKRNVALRYADGTYVLFADDDVEFHPAYLAEAAALMDEFPAIVAFSGKLLKNGDISREEARGTYSWLEAQGALARAASRRQEISSASWLQHDHSSNGSDARNIR